MLRRIPRLLRFSVIGAVALAVMVSVFQSWSSGVPGTNGITQTQWGPVDAADRDLLAKVRQAGLWEGPVGQQAMQQASTAEVREVGQIISTQHSELDDEVRRVADQLGVLLPSQVTAQQAAWMAEIGAANGAEYDRLFAQRLREAHGNVLPAIAQVRATTRNDLVRQFADTANTFVRGHIGFLEGTGRVDFAALPEPTSPGLLSGSRTIGELIVPFLVFVATLLGAAALLVGLRKRAQAQPARAVATPVVAPLPMPERTPRPATISAGRMPVAALSSVGAAAQPRTRHDGAPSVPGVVSSVEHLPVVAVEDAGHLPPVLDPLTRPTGEFEVPKWRTSQ